MKQNHFAFMALAVGLVSFTACNKNDDPVIPVYDVPTTYNFEKVDYTEAEQAVNMAFGLQTYLSKGASLQLNQTVVTNIWNNTSSPFNAENIINIPYTPDQLNSAKSIKLSSLSADPTVFKDFADKMVIVSQSVNVQAAQGTAGKLASNRIVSATGLEYNQLVVKGLMGALQTNKVFEHLDKSTTADNNTASAKGTAMQHEWDLAFGYISLPKDYDPSFSYTTAPVKAQRPLGIGGYFAERAKPIDAGSIVFGSFLKGRAAIGAKDYKTRDAAIVTIKEFVEKTLAISAYAYLNLSKTRTGDNARASRFHDYSEAYGFTLALKYRATDSKLSAANYQKLIDILKMDYWELEKTANAAKVEEAITILKTTYNFS